MNSPMPILTGLFLFMTVFTGSVQAAAPLRCASLFMPNSSMARDGRASVDSVVQANLAQLSDAELRAAGFTDLPVDKGGYVGISNTQMMSNLRLSELIIEYQENGKTVRRAGLALAVFQVYVRMYDIESGQIINLMHDNQSGVGGRVRISKIFFRGGAELAPSGKPGESQLDLDSLSESKPYRTFLSMQIREPSLGINTDLVVWISSRNADGNYVVRGLDGSTSIISAALIEYHLKTYGSNVFRVSAANLPRVVQSSASHRVQLADPSRKRRIESLVRGFKRTGEIYSEEFFASFHENPEIVKLNLRKLYPVHNPDLLIERVTKELGEEFLPLFLHPGIASRWGEALEFAKSRVSTNGKNESAYTIFKAFKEKAGTVRMMRGLMLDPAVVEQIKEKGLLAPALLSDSSIRETFAHLFDPFGPDPNLIKTLVNGTRSRLHVNRVYSDADLHQGHGLLMSFTNEEAIAASVPFHDAINAGASKGLTKEQVLKNQQLYIVTADVPVIDLFGNAADIRSAGRVSVGGVGIPLASPSVETFVVFSVAPEAITEILRIDSEPPAYGVSEK